MSAVFESTQLWPMTFAASLPECLSVSSTDVQSAATASSFLSKVIESVPVISSLQTLSAAKAPEESANSAAAATNLGMDFINRLLTSLSVSFRTIHTQALLHHRTRGGVLQELLLGGIEVMLDGERRERRLVEPRQDEFLLAGIGVDVAHGEDAGDAGLEFLGVDFQRLLLEIHAPLGDGTELRMQAEEREHVVGIEFVQRAVVAFHEDALEGVTRDAQFIRDALDVAHLARLGERAHLGDGGRRGAELRATMHVRYRRGLTREVHHPVERRIAAAEDHELLAVVLLGVPHAVVHLAAFEGLDSRRA